MPFVVAWLIAVLLEPVVRKLRLRGMSRGKSVMLITAGFFLVAGALVVAVAPTVSNQLTKVAGATQLITDRIANERSDANIFLRWNPAVKAQARGPVGWFDRGLEEFSPILKSVGLPSTRRAIIDQYIEPRREDILGIISNFFNGLVGMIGSAASQVLLLLFTPIFAYMMLLEMENLRMRTSSWIPPAIRASTMAIISDIGDVFKNYLRGVLMGISVHIVISAVIFSLLGMPYSILMAILAGVLSLMPFVGALLTGILIFVVTGLSDVSGNWFMSFSSPWVFAAVLVGVYVVESILYDNLVYARIVGKSVDLPPLVSLFVILSGGALFGLPGMLIAFPLAGSIKIVLGRLLRLTNKPDDSALRLPATPLRHRVGSG